MRRTLGIGAACLVLVAIANIAMAQRMPTKPGEKTHPSLQFDTNGDGKVDADERAAALAARNSAKGSGTSGAATAAAEKKKALKEQMDKVIAEFDTNGDGKLDAQEVAKARQTLHDRGELYPGEKPKPKNPFVEKYDTDHNGKLSPDESAEARRQMAAAKGGNRATTNRPAPPPFRHVA